jgi:hypothetical protein
VQLTVQQILKASPRLDARNLAAVEFSCAAVVDESLDEVEVNALPRLHEGPFDPGHGEQDRAEVIRNGEQHL